MRQLRHPLGSFLALVLVAPAALADVLVVAPSGAPFTRISDALVASQPGDIVLVKSGIYDELVHIKDRGRSVIADEDASVTVKQGISVVDLHELETVVLRGLTLPFEAVLIVQGCAGPVRIEACSFAGSSFFLTNYAAGVFASSQVSFAHCTLANGAAVLPFAGGPALQTDGSNVSLWQCSLTGGDGGDSGAGGQAPTAAGAGALLFGGTTVFDGCTLTGGTGGTGAAGAVGGPGGAGGDALRTTGGLVRHTDTSFTGGAGGPGGFGFPSGQGPTGPAGAGVNLVSGTVVPYADAARDLTVNSPVRSGEVANFEFGVVSCDAVLLLFSASAQNIWLGGPQGTLTPGLSLGTLAVALPCATGTLPFAAPIPALPAGLDGLNVHLQALHSNSTEGLQLGPFTVLTLLDSAIP
jgi:hypothetical protein